MKLQYKRLPSCRFIKKTTPTQMFFCEIYEIFKNNFPYRTLPMAASDHSKFEALTFEIMS